MEYLNVPPLYPAHRRLSQTSASDSRRQSIQPIKQRADSLSQHGDVLIRKIKLDGFRQFVAATSVLVKFLWFCLFSLATMVLMYEVFRAVSDYQQSPITTTYTIRTPTHMDFPQVYICNGNSMNRSYLVENLNRLNGMKTLWVSVVDSKKRRKRRIDQTLSPDQGMDDLFPDFLQYDQSAIDYFDPWTPTESPENLQKETLAQLKSILSQSLFLPDQVNDQIFQMHKRSPRTAVSKQEISEIKTVVDKNEWDAYKFLVEAGFSVDETFLKCQFGNAQELDCNKIVQPILDPNYFLCYVIKVPEEMKQSRSGQGLRLLINTHVSLYPTENEIEPNRYAGLLISVFKSFDPTNWLKSLACAGTLTKINLLAKNVQLLNLKSGPLIQPCVEDVREVYKIFNTSYSRTSCQMDCMMDAFYRHCQCILLVDKSLIRKDILETSTFCSVNRTLSCLIPNVTKSKTALAEIDECRKVCHTPCTEWRYRMSSSSAKLHSIQNHAWTLNNNSDAKLSDLIDLWISFNRIEYDELTQSPGKTVAQMVAAIGGQVNLWLGASIITLVHIFSLVSIFIFYMVLTKIRGEGVMTEF